MIVDGGKDTQLFSYKQRNEKNISCKAGIDGKDRPL